MLAEHARVLFGWIGKECTARGVFTARQLPEAIVRLRRGVQAEKEAAKRRAEEEKEKKDKPSGEEESEEPPSGEPAEEAVSLAQRAQPLIHLMEWTLKEEGFIIWEAPGEF